MFLGRSRCLLFLGIVALMFCLCCPIAIIGGSGMVIAIIPALPPSLMVELAGMEHQGTVDDFWKQHDTSRVPEFSTEQLREIEVTVGSASPTSEVFLAKDHPFYDYLSAGTIQDNLVVVYEATEAEANLVCGWEGDYCSGKVYDVDFKPGGMILYEVNSAGVVENSGVIIFVNGAEVSFGGLVIEGEVYTGSESSLASIWYSPIADLNEDLSHIFIQVDGRRLALKDTLITEHEIVVVFR
jgi:hypothetical protein